MLKILAFLTTTAAAFAGYAGSSTDNTIGGTAQYAGGGGGFSGVPFPQIPYFDFANLWQSYFVALQKYQQELASKGNAHSFSQTAHQLNSSAKATSSLTFTPNNGIQKNVGQFSQYGQPGSYGFSGTFPGGGYGGGYGYSGSSSSGQPGGFSGSFPGGGYGGGFSGSFGGNEGSVATASIGPGGAHQTASVYPENPNVPNVDTRYASPSSGGGGGGGVYGVFTSSQSATSNVGGKPVSFHKATTTVNDNGKVSTYTVQNP